MRAELDLVLEVLKAMIVICVVALFLVWTASAAEDIFVKDCKATGFYRADDTVIECKVLAAAERAKGAGNG